MSSKNYMDQIPNEASFFCLGLEDEEVAQPVSSEEMNPESENFCITEAEFTDGPSTVHRCTATASESSDLILVHEKATEIALNSNMVINEQPRELGHSSTELPTDMWNSLTYEESIVSYECDQDSWKFENLDDEQFSHLVSQYIPSIPGNVASASMLSAETQDSSIIPSVPNSICLSNMETELSDIFDLNNGANALTFDAFSAARPICDQNLGTAQQLLSPADTCDRHANTLLVVTSKDMQRSNLVHKAEQHHLVNNWIHNPDMKDSLVPGRSVNSIIVAPADCEYYQATGSDSQDDLCLREALLPKSESYLICDNSNTEIDLFSDEQHESGENIGMNCDEIKGNSPLKGCNDLAYSQSTDFMENEKSELSTNMTSTSESQSKNMVDNDVVSIDCSSELLNWNKSDTVLSCVLDQEKTLDTFLPRSSDFDSSSQNEDALPTSELTMTVTVCKLGLEGVANESSQIEMTIDDRDSFIQSVKGKDSLSAESEPGCSNLPDFAMESRNKDLLNGEDTNVEVDEIHSVKNLEPLLTNLGNRDEVLDSDSSGGEVLLLEYANQEETCGQASRDVIQSVPINKSPDLSSIEKDALPGGSLKESQDEVFPRADAALTMSDNSDLPLCENSVESSVQLPIDNNDSLVEDLVESHDLMSSVTNQTFKETGFVAESISSAHVVKDFVLKGRKEFPELFDGALNENGLPSENLSGDELSSKLDKSIESDKCGSTDKNERCTSTPVQEENLIVVDDAEDKPPADCDINDVAKFVKKEKPWTFGSEASAEEGSWKDPVPYGLKECFCPHGVVSVMAGHFHCQECGVASLYKNSILRHEVMKHRVKHSSINIMYCELCPSFFVHSSQFRLHSKKHAMQIISSIKGEEQRRSDSEIARQDSPVTQSSASSANGNDSISQQRCRRSLSSWNWKLAFDCQNEMEQRSKKRRSDQVTGYESSTTDDKPDELVKSKLAKLDNETEKDAQITYYSAIEMGADGTKMTVRYPSYDGVLLPTLTKPCNSCPICHTKFARLLIQKSHYAQVHRIYLQGISVYSCKPCDYRTIYARDFEAHINKLRNCITVDNLNKSGFGHKNPASGCTLSLVDACTTGSSETQSPKRRGRSSNCFAVELQQLKKLRYSNSSEKNLSHTIERKRNLQSVGSNKAQTEMSKEISSEKTRWFFGSSTRSGLSPETHLNACVSNHICTSACVGDLATEEKSPSKKKCNKKKKTPVKKCGSGIDSASPSELFQPVIVDSYSCLPSTWTNISDNTTSDENWSCEDRSSRVVPFEEKLRKKDAYEELPYQFASKTSKAIKFFQNTRPNFLTTSKQKTLNPLQTFPKTKPRPQVALKSTSHQTCERMRDSVVKKTSSGSVLGTTRSREAPVDCRNSIVIHLSDSENESIDSENAVLVSAKCNRDVVASVSKSTERSSDRIHDKTFSRDNNSPGVLHQDKTFVHSHPNRKRDVNCSSNSQSGNYTPDEKNVLSDFHSDILCSVLEKRGFMKQCTCGVYFLSLPTYSLHCAWHSSGSPLRCSVCRTVSKDWYEFYSHIQNHCK